MCSAGPIIIAGVALGINATPDGTHQMDTHKMLGAALLGLYIVQVAFGALIHFVKSANHRTSKRPVHNYGHAILGLFIIALAFYQVHLGYDYEWPNLTGRDPLPRSVGIVWTVWVVVRYHFCFPIEIADTCMHRSFRCCTSQVSHCCQNNTRWRRQIETWRKEKSMFRLAIQTYNPDLRR